MSEPSATGPGTPHFGRAADEPRIVAKPLPAGQAYVSHPHAPHAKDSFPVYVLESVVSEIWGHAGHARKTRAGGLLIGHPYTLERGYFLEIVGFIPATSGVATSTSFKSTHATFFAATKQIEKRWPGQRLVGWHFTTPDEGAVISRANLELHGQFFDQPWQVAVMVDPVRKELGFYQWRSGRIEPCGYHVVT